MIVVTTIQQTSWLCYQIFIVFMTMIFPKRYSLYRGKKIASGVRWNDAEMKKTAATKTPLNLIILG